MNFRKGKVGIVQTFTEDPTPSEIIGLLYLTSIRSSMFENQPLTIICYLGALMAILNSCMIASVVFP
jgi:hypothetical protein